MVEAPERMGMERVCAVVVTFHPDDEVMVNLAAVRAQVEGLIVVDNGFDGPPLECLRAARERLGFELVEQGENLGVATALNRGVGWAREQGYGWVVLFDQDSRVTVGFVAGMMRCFSESRWGERLAILVPTYVDMRLGDVIPQPPVVDGSIEQASTSGSLMPMRIFDRFGMFMDELFIDGVDYEYSLRVRAEGFAIEECTEARLLHSPGSPTRHRFLGKDYQATNYSPLRRYYQERNKVLTMKKWGRRFPGFFWRQFTISAKEVLKVVLVEQGKATKFMAYLRGWWHGLLGRSGRAS